MPDNKLHYVRCCLGFLTTAWARPPLGDIPGALRLGDSFGGDGTKSPGFPLEEAKRQALRISKSQITKVDVVTASGDVVHTVEAPEQKY